MRRFFSVLSLSLMLLAALSCSAPKKVPYFQDMQDKSVIDDSPVSLIRIKPTDKLMILVNSRDPQLSSLFNLAYASRAIGQNTGEGGGVGNGYVTGYTVNTEGCIDFPILGKIHIAGLTRQEIAAKIKDILVSRNLVNDAIVTVEFMNLRVSVMGEVARPGRFPIENDTYTILDAISAAGDLTVLGERDKIKVLREENGKKVTYQVNLCSAEETMASPVYYLQQNDIVYVEPNAVKSRQSTVNGNNILSVSFWMSVGSFLMTIVTFLITLGVVRR